MLTKALFTDLDGTLLNDDREISQGNRQAIEKALKSGHKVIVTTGRPLVSAAEQSKKLGLDIEGCYTIAFNGGIIYDWGAKKVVYANSIPISLVTEVMAEAKKRGLHIQAYDEKYVLVEPFNEDDGVKKYCAKVNMEYRVIAKPSEIGSESIKLLCIDYDSQEKTEAFRQWINKEYEGRLHCFFSCREYIEIVPAGLSKGASLARLADILGIPMENTISAGDEENDLTMIEAAGKGCAVQNAVPKVKAIADYICERDNNRDGVAEIIERFMLAQE